VEVERPRHFLDGVAVLAFGPSPVCPAIVVHAPGFSMRARMSSTCQLARIGLSRSTIYRKIAEGTFPTQLKISTNGSGWHESDVNR
jgi:hypothetical protein